MCLINWNLNKRGPEKCLCSAGARCLRLWWARWVRTDSGPAADFARWQPFSLPLLGSNWRWKSNEFQTITKKKSDGKHGSKDIFDWPNPNCQFSQLRVTLNWPGRPRWSKLSTCRLHTETKSSFSFEKSRKSIFLFLTVIIHQKLTY